MLINPVLTDIQLKEPEYLLQSSDFGMISDDMMKNDEITDSICDKYVKIR